MILMLLTRGYQKKKVSYPNYGAQYLAQQIAIKRDSGGTRLVCLLTY